jgi:hypothetical protein
MATLAQALGWDQATAGDWGSHNVVRPRTAKHKQVFLLIELCAEARAYLASDSDVGLWLNAPLPNLRGITPAEWLRERGAIGLRELTYGMVDWMPRLPDGELSDIDEESAWLAMLAAAKEDAGVREFRRMLANQHLEEGSTT